MPKAQSPLQDLQAYMLVKRLPERTQLRLPEAIDQLLLPTSVDHTPGLPETHASQTTSKQEIPSLSLLPRVMYLNQSTALRVGPYQAYDNCLRLLAYGDAVTVIDYHHEYAQIQREALCGWVKKDSLSGRKDDVWPQCRIGQWYRHDDEVTKRTRLLLADEFFAAEMQLPLQPAEYISVVLQHDNRVIAWPQRTGRCPGQWHALLRGVMGIYISVHPLADSVMEWTDQSGLGHIGYVKEVTPDNLVRLEGIGILEDGIFESVRVPASLWREWQPVFIAVS